MALPTYRFVFAANFFPFDDVLTLSPILYLSKYAVNGNQKGKPLHYKFVDTCRSHT